jgi:dihydrofolate reductase
MDSQSSTTFTIIVACEGTTGGIGVANRLPWNIPEDMRHFREVTTGHIVIMGRKTWESLPKRSLPNRTVIVISSRSSYVGHQHDQARPTLQASSFDDALLIADSLNRGDGSGMCLTTRHRQIFVAGGQEVYRAALQHPRCGSVLMTEVRYCSPEEMPAFERFFPLDALDAAGLAILSDKDSGGSWARCPRSGVSYRFLTMPAVKH